MDVQPDGLKNLSPGSKGKNWNGLYFTYKPVTSKVLWDLSCNLSFLMSLSVTWLHSHQVFKWQQIARKLLIHMSRADVQRLISRPEKWASTNLWKFIKDRYQVLLGRKEQCEGAGWEQSCRPTRRACMGSECLPLERRLRDQVMIILERRWLQRNLEAAGWSWTKWSQILHHQMWEGKIQWDTLKQERFKLEKDRKEEKGEN